MGVFRGKSGGRRVELRGEEQASQAGGQGDLVGVLGSFREGVAFVVPEKPKPPPEDRRHAAGGRCPAAAGPPAGRGLLVSRRFLAGGGGNRQSGVVTRSPV